MKNHELRRCIFGLIAASLAAPAFALPGHIGGKQPMPDYCDLYAEIAMQSARMRQDGSDQISAARQAAKFFETFINGDEARESLDVEDRRDLAKVWSRDTTGLIQATYSMPIEKSKKRREKAVLDAGDVARAVCGDRMQNGGSRK